MRTAALSLAVVLALALPLLTGCGSVDCIYSKSATAYVAENRNGARDAGEPPLTGVTFAVVDIGTQRVWARRTSDGTGYAPFDFMYGCSNKYEVRAETPVGYRATTPDRQRNGAAFLFGFARDEMR